MRIELNGAEHVLAPHQTAGGLLEELGLDRRAVVVEINRRVIRRDRLDEVILHPGDQVEVVHFVSGG